MRRLLKIISTTLAYIAVTEIAVSQPVADAISDTILDTIGETLVQESIETFISEESSASPVSDKKSAPLVFSVDVGAEYLYDAALPNSPIEGTMWDSNTVSWGKPDPLGPKGHLFHVNSNFEWRWGNLSVTAFGGLNANFIPAIASTAVQSTIIFLQGEQTAIEMLLQALAFPVVNFPIFILMLVTVLPFVVWLGWTLLCAASILVMPIIVPLWIVFASFPLYYIGGSVDWHPFANSFFDTKLSLGTDVDLYRLITNAGVVGIFAQAEASIKFGQFKAYADAGYRADIRNIVFACQGREPYIPGPYVKAGICWHLESHY